MNLNAIETKDLVAELERRCHGLVLTSVETNDLSGDKWFSSVKGSTQLIHAIKMLIEMNIQSHKDDFEDERVRGFIKALKENDLFAK